MSSQAIRPIQGPEIESIGGMVGRRFLEDPKTQAELTGVFAKEAFVKALMTVQIRHYAKYGQVFVLDNGQGLLALHHKKHEGIIPLMRLVNEVNTRVNALLSTKEMEKVAQNQSRLGMLNHVGWKRKACKGPYYHIDILCVDERLKGTGACRTLLDEAFALAGDLPILIETHNRDNLPLYRHFGFELVAEYAAREGDIKQYCLIRRP